MNDVYVADAETTPEQILADHRSGGAYVGACPTCGSVTGAAYVGWSRYAWCQEHKLRWRIGESEFLGWYRNPELDSYTELAFVPEPRQ